MEENAQAPVDKDSPLWRAWEKYVRSDAYCNTRRWATHPDHAEGSLWAAFAAGFTPGYEEGFRDGQGE